MERVRYPWWVTPLFGIMAVGFFIPALGGPDPILSATVGYQVVLAAAASVAAGIVVMVVAEWWGRRIVPPRNLKEATKRGQFRLGWMIVIGVVWLIALKTAAQSPSGISRAVIFGLSSGVFLGGAMVLPFDTRRRVPSETSNPDRRGY